MEVDEKGVRRRSDELDRDDPFLAPLNIELERPIDDVSWEFDGYRFSELVDKPDRVAIFKFLSESMQRSLRVRLIRYESIWLTHYQNYVFIRRDLARTTPGDEHRQGGQGFVQGRG